MAAHAFHTARSGSDVGVDLRPESGTRVRDPRAKGALIIYKRGIDMRATFVLSATALTVFTVACSEADRATSEALATPAVPTGPSAIVTSAVPDVSG